MSVNLPSEIWEKGIFLHLDRSALGIVEPVCKKWRDLTKSAWSLRFQEHFHFAPLSAQNGHPQFAHICAKTQFVVLLQITEQKALLESDRRKKIEDVLKFSNNPSYTIVNFRLKLVDMGKHFKTRPDLLELFKDFQQGLRCGLEMPLSTDELEKEIVIEKGKQFQETLQNLLKDVENFPQLSEKVLSIIAEIPDIKTALEDIFLLERKFIRIVGNPEGKVDIGSISPTSEVGVIDQQFEDLPLHICQRFSVSEELGGALLQVQAESGAAARTGHRQFADLGLSFSTGGITPRSSSSEMAYFLGDSPLSASQDLLPNSFNN